MSSNIVVSRQCEYCQKDFIAKKRFTRYCSHKCNQKHYKQRLKEGKIQKSNHPIISLAEQILTDKDFVSVPNAARLAGVSERTIFRMMCRRVISPVRQGRKVFIKVNDLLKQKSYENIY